MSRRGRHVTPRAGPLLILSLTACSQIEPGAGTAGIAGMALLQKS